MADTVDILDLIKESLDVRKFQDEHWEGSFSDYIKLVQENPLIIRTAHQRLYDMVLSHGVEEIEDNKEKLTKYLFFEDPIDGGDDGLFGLERPLMNLMSVFKAAAHGFGPGEARPAATRPGRIRQVDDRPALEEGGSSTTPAAPRARSTRSPGTSTATRSRRR